MPSQQKTNFASACQVLANTLALARSQGVDLQAIWFDRGYNSGGGNQIVDADVAAQGLTAVQVQNYVNTLVQLEKLWSNQAVTTGAYGLNANVMRTDR